jgi:hypothetical protein
MRRIVVTVSIALAVLLGLSAVADALFVTDEERLEAFVDAISGDIETGRIDDALRFVSTRHEEVALRAPGQNEWFGEGDDAELGALARERLAPHLGQALELVQHSVRVDEDAGHVGVRLRGPRGLMDVAFELRKHGERWYVRSARIR